MEPELKKVKDLTPWELNPRQISDTDRRILMKTLNKYGDLGGIVFNRKNQRLVTAHQRSPFFNSETPIIITHKFDAPTKTGTVALGYVENEGERFNYREVEWDDQNHAAAALAANKAGGDWEWQKLKDLMLGSFGSKSNFDREYTGWNDVELENLFGEAWTPDQQEKNDDEEKRGSNAQERIEDFLSADMRQVILWFGVKEFEKFNVWCAKLMEETGKETKTEAIFDILQQMYGEESDGAQENLSQEA